MTIPHTTGAAYVAPPPPWWTAILRAASPIAVSLIVASVLFVWVLPKVNGYKQGIIADCGIYVILAVSLTVVNGFTGQFSIGHSGFMSLGGYAAASLVFYGGFRCFGDVDPHGGLLSHVGSLARLSGHWFGKGDLLFAVGLLFGGLVAAAIGWVVGLPSLRLRGDYLAIVTLGFCEIVRILIQQTPLQLAVRPTDPDAVEEGVKYLGDGSLPSQMIHLNGSQVFTFSPDYGSVFWITVVATLTILVTVRLKLSAYGRALISIREDEIAASAVGVNVARLKVRAFVFSAFFAGVAGGLVSLRAGTINAGDLGFQKSFDLIIMVVLGGMGSISGAAIAAIVLTIMPEWLRDPQGLWPWGWVGVAVLAGLLGAFGKRPKKSVPALIVVCLIWEGLVHFFPWYNHHHDPHSPDQYLKDYQRVLYALMLILMMIVRPQGLFGIHEIWDYLPARWRGQRVAGAGSSRTVPGQENFTAVETDTR